MVQKEWYTWNELLGKWGMQDFELLSLFKEGLKPFKVPGLEIHCPYKYHEYPFLNEEHGRLNELFRVLADLKYKLARKGNKKAESILISTSRTKNLEERREKRKICRRLSLFKVDINLLRKKAPDIPIIPQNKKASILIPPERIENLLETLEGELTALDRKMEQIIDDDQTLNKDRSALKWKYFRLPSSKGGIKKLMKDLEIEEAIFRHADVLRIDKLRQEEPPLKDEGAQEVKNEEGKTAEEALKGLKIICTNPLEFEIWQSGKQRVVNPTALGCRNAKTLEWKTVIAIISDPDHKFHLNYGDVSNESRRKLRDKINEKLVAYFKLPRNSKLYSRNENDEPGVFRFKLGKTSTEKESRFADLTIEDLITEIGRLNKYPNGDSQENDEYAALMNELKRRKIPEEEIIKYYEQGQIAEVFNDKKWEGMPEKDCRMETFARKEEAGE